MFHFSQYKTTSLLGQGGMAKVYLAEHKSLGHKVAIKVLNKEYFHNDNIRKRFLAEARSLARMNHPNIVRVMDLIEENESAAFVMEHIEGRTLRDYLQEKGKLKDNEIKHLFGQMLEAVGYVHEKGLIHRDIKPSNFMLDERGNIKLLDFGIAKAQDASSAEYTQTGTGLQMGTPMYMSPEQIVSTKAVTTQSDIYSLGVVLWQMVTGLKPYDSATLSTFQIQAKIVNEPLPETHSNWDDLIRKATQKDLKTRFIQIQNIKLFEPKTIKTKQTKVVQADQTVIATSGRFKSNDKLSDTVIEKKKPVSPVWMDEELISICQYYQIEDYQNKKLFEILRLIDHRNLVDYTRLKNQLNKVSIIEILDNKPDFFFKKTDLIDKSFSIFFALVLLFILCITIFLAAEKVFNANFDLILYIIITIFVSIYLLKPVSRLFYSEIPKFKDLLNDKNQNIKEIISVMRRIDLKYEVENLRNRH
jgi:serine/threonine protein kinase